MKVRVRRHRRLRDGQWSKHASKRRNGSYVHGIKCCDCGLEHIVQYRLTKRGLKFRAWRG